MWTEGEATLIHGDNHIGNLFLDDGPVGFSDWALASPYPGRRDVANFLCNSLPTEVRRAEEGALISRYRTSVAGLGIELSDELAQEQYRLYAIYVWIAATTTIAMGSQWQTAEVARNATLRTTQAAIDLGVVHYLQGRLAAS